METFTRERSLTLVNVRRPAEHCPEYHMSSLEASDLIPTRERWIAGPEGQHLLWIPSYFPSITYAPGNTLVIPDALQLDFSHFSRGTSWQMCRKY